MSIGGNANYTHIRAHGTPGPFVPSFISQAGVTGPYGTPVENLYKRLDVNVDIAGALTGAVFDLGDAIPRGCVITQASVNGHRTVTPGTLATYELGLAASAGGTIVLGISPVDAPASAGAPASDESINSGLVNSSVTIVGADTFPVLEVVLQDLTETGTINVKIVYYCP